MKFSVGRIKRCRLFKFVEGALRVAAFQEIASACFERAGVFWIEPPSFAQVGDGRVHLATPHADCAAMGIGVACDPFASAGVGGNGCGEIHFGLDQIANLFFQFAAA